MKSTDSEKFYAKIERSPKDIRVELWSKEGLIEHRVCHKAERFRTLPGKLEDEWPRVTRIQTYDLASNDLLRDVEIAHQPNGTMERKNEHVNVVSDKD